MSKVCMIGTSVAEDNKSRINAHNMVGNDCVSLDVEYMWLRDDEIGFMRWSDATHIIRERVMQN